MLMKQVIIYKKFNKSRKIDYEYFIIQINYNYIKNQNNFNFFYSLVNQVLLYNYNKIHLKY